MKIDVTKNELKQKVLDAFNEADDKNEGFFNAIETYVSAKNQDLIEQIVSDAKANNRSGFRQLTDNEKAFYNILKAGAKQAVTADQIDIIPTETIDFTLNDIKEPSGIRKLIRFAPANVKKWLFGSKTGGASWGTLTSTITAEITAALTPANMDVFKLSAYCVIPKAIRDLEIGYVDRYFTAVLNEAIQDGEAYAFLYGDGKVAPVGVTKQIGSLNVDGTHKNKTKVANVTKLSPKGLATVLKTLTNNGKRKVSKLYIVCNPLDEAEYVNPALYGDSVTGGWVNKSFMPIEVIADANVTQGDGVFTIENAYTMGYSGAKVDEYKETKALEDADLIIAKVYANGRADDDNTAVYFDITKLEEYVSPLSISLTTPVSSGE